jgi:hypothetical protein
VKGASGTKFDFTIANYGTLRRRRRRRRRRRKVPHESECEKRDRERDNWQQVNR